MDKEVVIYICNKILPSNKKEWNPAICNNMDGPWRLTWMDLEGVMLSELSQRKTNTVWFHSYVESQKPK